MRKLAADFIHYVGFPPGWGLRERRYRDREECEAHRCHGGIRKYDASA